MRYWGNQKLKLKSFQFINSLKTCSENMLSSNFSMVWKKDVDKAFWDFHIYRHSPAQGSEPSEKAGPAKVQSRAAKWGHHLAITYTSHYRDCTSVYLVVSEMQLNAVRNAKWGQEWSQKGSLSALKSLPFLPLRVFPGGNLE